MSAIVPSLFAKLYLLIVHTIYLFFSSLCFGSGSHPDVSISLRHKYSTRGDSFIHFQMALAYLYCVMAFFISQIEMSRMSRVESSIIFESHELNHELNDLNRMNRIHQIKTISQSHASNTRPTK